MHTCLINLSTILYHNFSLNIYEYLKHHQHQYINNQIHQHYSTQNHRYIHTIQSFSNFQLKNILKHNRAAFISEYFTLNLYISTSLTNISLFTPLSPDLKQNFLCCSAKYLEYSFSPISVVSSKSSIGPLTRIKISCFIFQDIISAPNKYYYIFTNSTTIRQRKFSHASNPIPEPEYLYLSGSVFLINSSTLNKEFSDAKSL